jgi:plastocyanin
MTNLHLLVSHFTKFLILFLSLLSTGTADVTLKIEDQNGKPVQDAVIWVPGIGKATPTTATICQKQRQFSPMVTVIPVGTQVRFPNRDTVQHHIYSFSPVKQFDIPLYSGESAPPITFDKPGVITIGCNIHDWMSAYIVVLDTTAFAQTGADGIATIRGVQASVTVQVWHPQLKTKIVEAKTALNGKIVLSLRPIPPRTPPDDSESGY